VPARGQRFERQVLVAVEEPLADDGRRLERRRLLLGQHRDDVGLQIGGRMTGAGLPSGLPDLDEGERSAARVQEEAGDTVFPGSEGDVLHVAGDGAAYLVAPACPPVRVQAVGDADAEDAPQACPQQQVAADDGNPLMEERGVVEGERRASRGNRPRGQKNVVAVWREAEQAVQVPWLGSPGCSHSPYRTAHVPGGRKDTLNPHTGDRSSGRGTANLCRPGWLVVVLLGGIWEGCVMKGRLVAGRGPHGQPPQQGSTAGRTAPDPAPAPAQADPPLSGIWPGQRLSSYALLGLLLAQAALFFVVTRRGFFSTDDYFHFMLAEERHFLYYVVTPLFDMLPAPGHRLMTYLLHHLLPLNYTAAQVFFLLLLAGATVLLAQLVRIFARSEQWWTVLLLAPFAFSVTLVSPVSWWSNGLPVLPNLLFTAVALVAWLRSYTAPKRALWLVVTVAAVAAAGAFYIKFLLIPVYMLILRLAVLPGLLGLPRGVRGLWAERARWLAIAAPAAAFVGVFALSGLAGTSMSSGERPFVEYFGAAWFHGLIPVAFLNAEIDPATRFSLSAWAVVACSQAVLLAVVAATWGRSRLALRAWGFFVLVFALNAAMVGAARLGGFGVDIAYHPRYYPEVVFFLPVVLALCLHQGAARNAAAAWERSGPGRAAIVLFACLYVATLAVWAPRIVDASPGAQARLWFDALRHDLAAVEHVAESPRILDSDAPEFVMPQWMGPHNRISTVLGLMDIDATFNEHVEPTYLVLEDGRLAEATFRPLLPLVSGGVPAGEVGVTGDTETDGGCWGDGALEYRPGSADTGSRQALSISYGEGSVGSGFLEVEFADPNRPSRRLELRPERSGELLDLGTAELSELRLLPAAGGVMCIDAAEIGTVVASPLPGERGRPE
jgi:hypothetical protein